MCWTAQNWPSTAAFLHTAVGGHRRRLRVVLAGALAAVARGTFLRFSHHGAQHFSEEVAEVVRGPSAQSQSIRCVTPGERALPPHPPAYSPFEGQIKDQPYLMPPTKNKDSLKGKAVMLNTATRSPLSTQLLPG